MSWLDRYDDASFKGVGFKVSNHSLTVGRKVVKHEYPEQDIPFMEDMGRKYRTYTITGYIIGTDYDVVDNSFYTRMGSRDQLITALESSGPGTLVHPYLGKATVIAEPSSITEKKEEGGMCRFTITFIEQGALTSPSPTEVVDNNSEIAALIDDKNDNIIETFLEEFDITGQLEIVSDAAREMFEEIGEKIDTVISIARLPIDAAAEVQTIIGLADGFINSTIIDYESLAKGYLGIFTLLGEGSRFQAMLQTLRGVFGVEGQEGDDVTTSGAAINSNNAATIKMISGITATTSIQFAIAATSDDTDDEAGDTFTSTQDAITQRDLLGEEIDTLMYTEEDDEQFIAWRELYNQLYASVPGAENDIGVAATVVINSSMPALVMAHGLYGDASQELDIVRRNNPHHPGFMPATVGLEIKLP